MSYDPYGYRYLKTGDESGDLCVRCDVPLLIDKRVRKNQKKDEHSWQLWCPCCGRRIEFASEWNRYGKLYL
jgi:RNase P subunit RPR2